MRHAETDFNSENRWMGVTDLHLNKSGLEQAKSAAAILGSIEFDAIYCSPLLRALQTADAVASKQLHRKVLIEAGFAERGFGVLEGKIKTDELRDKIETSQGVEPLLSVQSRLAKAISRIPPHGTFLVISHSGIFRVLLTRFGCKPSPDLLYLKNAEWVELNL